MNQDIPFLHPESDGNEGPKKARNQIPGDGVTPEEWMMNNVAAIVEQYRQMTTPNKQIYTDFKIRDEKAQKSATSPAYTVEKLAEEVAKYALGLTNVKNMLTLQASRLAAVFEMNSSTAYLNEQSALEVHERLRSIKGMILQPVQMMGAIDLSMYEVQTLILSLHEIDKRRNKAGDSGKTTDFSEGVAKHQRRLRGPEGNGLSEQDA